MRNVIVAAFIRDVKKESGSFGGTYQKSRRPPSHEYPFLLGILCKKERFDQKCHALTSHLSSFDHGIDDL